MYYTVAKVIEQLRRLSLFKKQLVTWPYVPWIIWQNTEIRYNFQFSMCNLSIAKYLRLFESELSQNSHKIKRFFFQNQGCSEYLELKMLLIIKWTFGSKIDFELRIYLIIWQLDSKSFKICKNLSVYIYSTVISVKDRNGTNPLW